VKVHVVGGGGREHALAWALSRSPLVESVTCAPGNAGMAEVAERHRVDAEDLRGQVALANKLGPDLVVVGSEVPLVEGLADALRTEGVRVFGPSGRAAMIEGSKSFAKRLMSAADIPTAEARAFDDFEVASRFIEDKEPPIVVKADGLAAGKGVTVCADLDEAREALRAAMVEGRFGDAGRRVLVEEALVGRELSVFALSDGRDLLPMAPARDFKRAFEGDEGPNTGGMGSYSPVPDCTPEVLDRVVDEILQPAAAALRAEGIDYLGVLYAGLMLTSSGPKVIEFNCRFGDPETQALIPRLEGDLAEALAACIEGRLSEVKMQYSDQVCVSVVAASGGYPGSYETGIPVEGLPEASAVEGVTLFHAGTEDGPAGGVVTSGGRVLAVSALGEGFAEARRRAEDALGKVSFDGMRYRSDIGAEETGDGS
jgi:phosphoribosylamine--glycine ligase